MIQFKRGSTESWKKLKKPLAAGQPGYDKDKHKIKVGDGVKLWDKLPYAGLSEEDVLDSEKNAKKRLAQDPESMVIITYGEESPDKNTVGQLYLQHYETMPEVDHVVEMGTSGIWTYRKWRSGLAECWGTFKHTTAINEPIAGGMLFYDNTAMKAVKYPPQVNFNFNENSIPCESASIQSNGWIVWLSATSKNTAKNTAIYRIIGTQSAGEPADYYITFNVKGRWKK